VRGDTTVYGPIAVKEFLQSNGLEAIVRAHESVDAWKTVKLMPVTTVFSASTYSVETSNSSGVLVVRLGEPPEPRSHEPIVRMRREETMFFMAGRSHRPCAIPTGMPSAQSTRVPSMRVDPMGGMHLSSIALGQRSVGRGVAPMLLPLSRKRSDAVFNLTGMYRSETFAAAELELRPAADGA
jgi:hypothetical protein